MEFEWGYFYLFDMMNLVVSRFWTKISWWITTRRMTESNAPFKIILAVSKLIVDHIIGYLDYFGWFLLYLT
jgi:hypothetical protein